MRCCSELLHRYICHGNHITTWTSEWLRVDLQPRLPGFHWPSEWAHLPMVIGSLDKTKHKGIPCNGFKCAHDVWCRKSCCYHLRYHIAAVCNSDLWTGTAVVLQDVMENTSFFCLTRNKKTKKINTLDWRTIASAAVWIRDHFICLCLLMMFVKW